MHSPCAMRSAANVARLGAEASSAVGIEQDREAQQNAKPAIDAMAEQRHAQACNRHPERAGIDREPHGSWSDAVGPRQRWQDRLCREQVDKR